MDDLIERVANVERTVHENAVAIERAAGDARAAKDAAAEFRPIVLARSGDEQRRDKFELNVNQAHDKIREQSARLERVEKWIERIVWIGIGIVAVGQAIWWLVSKILEKGSQ